MKYKIVILLLIFSSNIFADGILKVKSDIQEAYIFVDGKKKAMTGDEYTKISLPEGEHIIRIYKEDKSWNYEGEKNIFVGNETETSINIATKKIPLITISTPKDLIEFLVSTIEKNDKKLFISLAMPSKEILVNYAKQRGADEEGIKRTKSKYASVVKKVSSSWNNMKNLTNKWGNSKAQVSVENEDYAKAARKASIKLTSDDGHSESVILHFRYFHDEKRIYMLSGFMPMIL